MDVAHDIEQPVEKDNIIPFNMQPKEPQGPDWLSELPQETIFLARGKGQALKQTVLVQFEVKNAQAEKARLLVEMNPDRSWREIWVVPVLFCSTVELVEIIRTPAQEQE